MKILIVCEIGSIHSAKWINQFTDGEFDFHIFQINLPGNKINKSLISGTVYYPGHIRNNKIRVIDTIIIPEILLKILCKVKIIKKYFYNYHMSFLVRLIKNIKPDLIYSQGLCVNYKNLLLPVLNAKRKLGLNVFPKWLYSSWGADLDYYPKISAQNEEEVKRVISECDYLITECDRDRDLAFKFGFKGKYLDKLPAFGGVKLDYLKNYISQGDPSERRIILLKGRDNADGLDQVGRAMVVMNALPYLKDDLKDYEINIFQASSIVKETAAKLEREHKIKIKILEYVPYDELLRIFGRSKIFISFTINDGLPSSLVEAMALGAYPILSDLAPFREWIRNCENGNLIGNNDPAVFVKMMKGALADDSLINRAAKINYQIVKDRLEFDFIKNKYSEILHAI